MSDSNESYGGGMFIAALLSYILNHSLLWAVFHGLLGPFYIVYAVGKGILGRVFG